MMRLSGFLILLVLLGVHGAVAEPELPHATTVSYVTGTTIYLKAGRDSGLAPGDSVRIYAGEITKGIAVIFAVSASSSAAHPIDSTLQAAMGDSAAPLSPRPVRPPESIPVARSPLGPEAPPSSNVQVHGRVAAQLFASRSDDNRWDLLQPSLLTRLDVSGILNSDLTLSVFGRTSRDFSERPGSGGVSPTTMLRLYDLSLRYGQAGSWLGIGFGRITSRNVSGLGAFDGAEFLVRLGLVTAGVVGGSQPNYQTSSMDPDRRKVAAYVNLRFGADPWTRNDITVAYGRQYFRGTLDREFLYLQSSLSPSRRLVFYQSTELDLRQRVGNETPQNLHMTNTYVTLSWMPTEWLTTSAGYDASRPLILLESTTTLVDTLLDRTLQQGMRASATVRLPMRLSATVNGGLRLQSETSRQSHSYGAGLRAHDIGATGISAGAQYLHARALYTEGDDVTVTIDSWITRWISASLRYDRYAYTLAESSERSLATTLSLSATFRLAGPWYAMANLDRLWDRERSAYRVFTELSLHF